MYPEQNFRPGMVTESEESVELSEEMMMTIRPRPKQSVQEDNVSYMHDLMLSLNCSGKLHHRSSGISSEVNTVGGYVPLDGSVLPRQEHLASGRTMSSDRMLVLSFRRLKNPI